MIDCKRKKIICKCIGKSRNINSVVKSFWICLLFLFLFQQDLNNKISIIQKDITQLQQNMKNTDLTQQAKKQDTQREKQEKLRKELEEQRKRLNLMQLFLIV